MTQEDYEQKKRECWKEYIKLGGNNNGNSAPFNRVFRYAYALGKHGQKVFDNALGKQKEAISQEEIEKAAQERADSILYDYRMEDMLRDDLRVDMINLFKDAIDFALGKHENDADTVIQGWVARDKGRFLGLYPWQPKRGDMAWLCGSCLALPINTFPDLTWESEPIEVELIIKRKKK